MTAPLYNAETCERCGGENDRASWANWCSRCAAWWEAQNAAIREQARRQNEQVMKEKPE